MLGISHSVLGVTNCCVETLLIPLENTGRPCDQLAESDPKEPGCFEGRHPLQGGFPHPLNAAREIQRRTMRSQISSISMNKWTILDKRKKGSALSSLSSPSCAAREIQRP